MKMEEEERPKKIRRLSHHHSQEGSESPIPLNVDKEEESALDPRIGDNAGTETVESNDTDNVLQCVPDEKEQSTIAEAPASPPPVSKSQLKKLRRQQQWEQGRADRKAKRKEKIKEKRERKRAAKQEEAADTYNAASGTPTGEANGSSPAPLHKQHRRQRAIQLPVTFIFDCDFDELMSDKERISLASQLTRCYSDNRNAHFRAHLVISSFKGKLRERFDGVLAKHYESWQGVRFFDEDFVAAAEQAIEWMRRPAGGRLAGVFAKQQELQQQNNQRHEQSDQERPADGESSGRMPTEDDSGEVIYLTSDSPNTLSSLSPYSTYIIGGLVDRNRHKGICYKRAMDRGVKTARLPIGEFMEMNSRFVLATNHVCEIMLRWLESGDWGEAFMKVMPKRKGGELKGRKDGVGEVREEDRDLNEVEGQEENGYPVRDNDQGLMAQSSEQRETARSKV